MKKSSKVLNYYEENGIFLFLRRVLMKIINCFYNFLIFHRKDCDIDYTANIRGADRIKIGKNFHAGKYLWLDAVTHYRGQDFSPKIIIGDNVGVQDFVHIGATNYVEIGDEVLFASKVYVTDHNHGIYEGIEQSRPYVPPALRKLTNDKIVIVGKRVWVGDGVVILPGVHIGEGCIIGSNSVVTKNIPKFSMAAGVPAKVIKVYDDISAKWINVEST